jgi:hypothetical protein
MGSEILELHSGRIENAIAGARVVHPDDWLRTPQRRLVLLVSGARARAEIRGVLDQAGLSDGIDYVCAA